MKKTVLVLLVALVALNLGMASKSYAQGKVVRVSLIDENGSGEDGSAQLTDMGNSTTKVELIMLNAPDGAVQPAHIHEGTCANLTAKPAYPLNDVKEGKSTTTVKVSLADLTKAKYAINVHKSAAEVSVYVSCGNLPQTTASNGPMTMDQALSTLLDNANELLGTIKNKETDAAKNAYTIYHTTFAAHANEIKAKSAATQSKLDSIMNEVNDALTAGDWAKAETAANELVDTIKQAQSAMGKPAVTTVSATNSTSGSTADASLLATMSKLQNAALDVQREAKNKDKEGLQNAYNAFHTLFAANEDAIKAKDAQGQANIDSYMGEVNDALNSGDWTKAGAAADELVNEVNGTASGMGGSSSSSLPTSGNGEGMLMLYTLAGASLALVFAGTTLRRRTVR